MIGARGPGGVNEKRPQRKPGGGGGGRDWIGGPESGFDRKLTLIAAGCARACPLTVREEEGEEDLVSQKLQINVS